MTAPVYVILMRAIELTTKEAEKGVILVGLRLKRAKNGVPYPQIADAPTPDLQKVLALKIAPDTGHSKRRLGNHGPRLLSEV